MLGMKHSTDMLNGAWDYPNASTAGRRQIRRKHIDYILGLLWFMATDPASSPSLRAELATLGYCTDEYGPPQTFPDDPPHWPYQLYVREAARLVGDWVWTEMDPPAHYAARSVGVGGYSFDCHWVSLYAENSSVSGEGRVNQGANGTKDGGVTQTSFPMPFDVMLPRRTELTNLLVPVEISASHVRYNAIRMEPAWMVLGHAAGTAAVLALDRRTTVQDVDVPALQALLLRQKQLIEP